MSVKNLGLSAELEREVAHLAENDGQEVLEGVRAARLGRIERDGARLVENE